MNTETKVKAPDLKLHITALNTLEKRVLNAARKGLDSGLQLTRDHAIQTYMQGPAPGKLREITGRLTKSLEHKTEVKDGRVLGIIGSNLRYAAFHEFGFKGDVEVGAHTRVLQNVSGTGRELKRAEHSRGPNGEFRGYKQTRKDVARDQKSGVATFTYVKAHTRELNYAGRPYLRPALKDKELLILDEINDGLREISRQLKKSNKKN